MCSAISWVLPPPSHTGHLAPDGRPLDPSNARRLTLREEGHGNEAARRVSGCARDAAAKELAKRPIADQRLVVAADIFTCIPHTDDVTSIVHGLADLSKR